MRADDPRHGTSAGHYAHRRDGEKSCDLCRAAFTEYVRLYKLGYRRIDNVKTIEDTDVALVDGKWVLDPKTRVMRWQADPPRVLKPACPRCGAYYWQPCTSKTGKRQNNPHQDRIGIQTCRCRARLLRGTNTCAACAGKAVDDAA